MSEHNGHMIRPPRSKSAQELVALRREAEKGAATPALMAAAKARMLAEVDAVKADLACRVACVQVLSLIGRP